ncbi:unnamed protein product, partial [Urochloa humidicola]
TPHESRPLLSSPLVKSLSLASPLFSSPRSGGDGDPGLAPQLRFLLFPVDDGFGRSAPLVSPAGVPFLAAARVSPAGGTHGSRRRRRRGLARILLRVGGPDPATTAMAARPLCIEHADPPPPARAQVPHPAHLQHARLGRTLHRWIYSRLVSLMPQTAQEYGETLMKMAEGKCKIKNLSARQLWKMYC